MIWALVLLWGWIMIGRMVVRLVDRDLPFIVELAFGVSLGSLIIAYALFGLGWWLSQSMITYGLTFLAGVGIILGWPRGVKVDLFWGLVVVCASLFFVSLYLGIWQQDITGIALRMRGVWGDWGHHIGLPLYYQAVNHTTWASPFTAGFSFTYSFLNAFIPTALLHLGTSLRFSILVPGIVWSVALTVGLVALGSAWGVKKLACLAPVLLFMSGHLGFIHFFQDLKNAGGGWVDFLSHLPTEYGHWWEGGYHLGNFLDFFFVSQRSYLLGMGVGLTILLIVIRHESKKSRLFAGVLLGLLPLVHMHTFISLSVILGVWTLSRLKTWKQEIWLWLPALVIAAPYFGWLYHTNTAISSGSFLSFKVGWLSEGENWVWFWLKNAPILITGILGSFLVSPKLRGLVVGSWLVFAMANLIQFQPNLADNNKLIVWWYLLAGIYPTLLLLQKIRQWWVTVIVVVLLTLSGWLQLAWVSQNAWEFATSEDLALAEFAKASCVDRRWLTSDRHNHPVFTFAGRPMVLGYRGWLWTWGINYSQIETDIKLMYTEPSENAHLFSKYNVSYVVIGSAESREFHPNIQDWYSLYKIVYHTPEYLVFAVNPCQSSK